MMLTPRALPNVHCVGGWMGKLTVGMVGRRPLLSRGDGNDAHVNLAPASCSGGWTARLVSELR